jgi:elongation factor P
MITANEIRKGQIIKFEGNYHTIYSAMFITKGNKRAFVQVKMRNMKTGSMIEKRFSSDEKIDLIHTEQRDAQFLYKDANSYVFMDNQTYEQIDMDEESLGDCSKWLLENIEVKINFLENNPISIQLPDTIKLKVVETEPYLKGATVTNQFKPARLENDVTIQVPPYVETGDVIMVDTRSEEFVGRA